MIIKANLLVLLVGIVLCFEDNLETSTSLSLTDKSSFLHLCDTREIVSSYQLAEDTMPCNYMYSSSAVENSFIPKFNASYVESFNRLSVV